ncbi:hypothetical protein OIU76_013425 [Salix suchowensis]|nr:hypothetical protein OIU76_013425 [Salix suchowensis]
MTKGTGETYLAILLSAERRLRWLVMHRSILSGSYQEGKDKRRSSIHDITTVNLNDARTPSPENKRPSPDQSGEISQQPNSAAMPRTHFQWNQPNGGGAVAFDSTNANMFMSAPYGINSYGLKMKGQNPHRGAVHDSYIRQQTMGFQMPSAHHYPHV